MLGQNVIDSREIQDRIDELEGMKDPDDPDALDDNEVDELKELQEVAEECSDVLGDTEWRDGVTLVQDSYFKRYAQESAEDIGAINNLNQWPATCIDWDEAAEQLKMDYALISTESGDYYCR